MRILLAVATGAAAHDDDLPPLLDALRARGADAENAVWDDPAVDWGAADLVVVRSVWDYARRRDAFLEWADGVAARTRLANPAALMRWNTDKRYLAVLAHAGVPIVPTMFLQPGDGADLGPLAGLRLVVKPTVSAGSLDTQGYGAADHRAAADHVRRLHGEGRAAMVQPYQEEVDTAGEAGLVFIGGAYSHAITKAAMLGRDVPVVAGMFREERIAARIPDAAEREAADHVLASLAWPAADLLYARVDLVPGPGGPLLLELELTEPSLFLAHGPGSADRMADAVLRAAGG